MAETATAEVDSRSEKNWVEIASIVASAREKGSQEVDALLFAAPKAANEDSYESAESGATAPIGRISATGRVRPAPTFGVVEEKRVEVPPSPEVSEVPAAPANGLEAESTEPSLYESAMSTYGEMQEKLNGRLDLYKDLSTDTINTYLEAKTNVEALSGESSAEDINAAMEEYMKVLSEIGVDVRSSVEGDAELPGEVTARENIKLPTDPDTSDAPDDRDKVTEPWPSSQPQTDAPAVGEQKHGNVRATEVTDTLPENLVTFPSPEPAHQVAAGEEAVEAPGATEVGEQPFNPDAIDPTNSAAILEIGEKNKVFETDIPASDIVERFQTNLKQAA